MSRPVRVLLALVLLGVAALALLSGLAQTTLRYSLSRPVF